MRSALSKQREVSTPRAAQILREIESISFSSRTIFYEESARLAETRLARNSLDYIKLAQTNLKYFKHILLSSRMEIMLLSFNSNNITNYSNTNETKHTIIHNTHTKHNAHNTLDPPLLLSRILLNSLMERAESSTPSAAAAKPAAEPAVDMFLFLMFIF